MKLTPSPLRQHKWRMTFKDGTHTDFGATGMDDYTRKHDKAQRERYRQRHKKDLETHDPKRAGFLSYYILWGESTNIHQNVTAYQARHPSL
jgi:Family of unknown function (DUF5754)